MRSATNTQHGFLAQVPRWIYAAFLLTGIYVAAKVIFLFFDIAIVSWIETLLHTSLTLLVVLALLHGYRRFIQFQNEATKDYIKLFRKNPYPMWVYDLKTLRFLTVNDAAIALYGYSEEEFKTMKISDIRPAEDVPALISSTDKIRLNFHHQYHWSGTWRHKKKSSEMIYVEVSSYEIIYMGTKAELVLAYNITEKVLQDQKVQALNQSLEQKVITRTNDLLNLNRRLIDQNKVIKSANLDLFTISNQLQEANKKIQEHADLKNRFIAMASHEFRTPLANISFSAAFVRRNLEKLDAEKILSKMKVVETHVEHMVALLDDVLTIGKADSVQLEVKNMPVEFYNFISGLIEEVSTATKNSHEFHLSAEDAIPAEIVTDPKFLRNIVINLLNNAVKYSPCGRTVAVRLYVAKDAIGLDITDQGMGIEQNDIEKIFEPFYRTNGTDTIQGTGLGLSIVKRAVDLLNAKIEITSEVGQGSTFSVLLPADNQSGAHKSYAA
jgi:PAS domain S-box-containing protein